MTSDARSTLARAYDEAGAIIAGTREDQYSLPTPCTEYDVLALTEHMVTGAARPSRAISGGSIEGDIELTGTVPVEGFIEVFGRARSDSLNAFEGDEVLEQEFTLPWATLSGRDLALMYAMEMAQHAWDLAVATGQEDKLDDATAQELMPVAEKMLPAGASRDELPFEAEQPIEASARPVDRLAAYLGRTRV
jgi:uncharacterized protein (TIGR03086 family)